MSNKPWGIRVEASDIEPGAIVLTIEFDGVEKALPPIGGAALLLFIDQLLRVVAQANEHVLPFAPALVEQFEQLTKAAKE